MSLGEKAGHGIHGRNLTKPPPPPLLLLLQFIGYIICILLILYELFYSMFSFFFYPMLCPCNNSSLSLSLFFRIFCFHSFIVYGKPYLRWYYYIDDNSFTKTMSKVVVVVVVFLQYISSTLNKVCKDDSSMREWEREKDHRIKFHNIDGKRRSNPINNININTNINTNCGIFGECLNHYYYYYYYYLLLFPRKY